MSFWDIVLEAKKSSTKQKDNDDALEVDAEAGEENEVDNFTDEVETGDDNTDEAEPDTASEDNIDTAAEEEPTADTEEPSTNEEGGEGMDVETTDDFDAEVMNSEDENVEGGNTEGETNTDEAPEGDTGDETEDTNLEDEQKDNDTVTREYNLLCDFEGLYELVTNCLGALDKVNSTNLIVAQICSSCRKNFNEIIDKIDRYLHFNYKTKSYVENLTVYNYLVQSVKITIEMLKNVNNVANK